MGKECSSVGRNKRSYFSVTHALLVERLIAITPQRKTDKNETACESSAFFVVFLYLHKLLHINVDYVWKHFVCDSRSSFCQVNLKW